VADEKPDYQIKARIVAEDATTTGAKSAERNLQKVEDKGKSVGAALMGYLGAAFAMLGGGAAVVGGLRWLTGLNNDIDQAQRGMAGLFTAQTGAPIAQSMQVARGVLQGLREDAKKGVGELGDYIDGFQRISGVAMGAGVSLEKIRNLTKLSLAAGEIVRPGQGAALAPMDIVQGLTSGANDKMTPIVEAALRAAGIADSAFNKMSIPKKIEALSTAFGKFAPAVELMGKSWGSQADTFSDNLKDIARLVSKPLFDAWLDRLRKANEWLEKNQDRIKDLATTWGSRLVSVWDKLIRQASTYAAIVAGAKLVSAMPGSGGRIGGALSGVRSAMSDPFGFGALMAGGEGAAAGGAGLMPALAELGSALGSVAIPAALVVAGVDAMVGGLREYPEVLATVQVPLDNLLHTFSMVGDTFANLTEEGSAFNMLGALLDLTLGKFFGGVLDGLREALILITSVVEGFNFLMHLIGFGLKSLMAIAHGDFAGARAWDAAGRQALEGSKARMSTLWGLDHDDPLYLSKFGTRHGKNTGLGTLELPKSKNPDTNINIGTVHIHPTTEVNADPARVAMAWGEGMNNLRLFPRQARRLPVVPA
jgi:hypothetical protein